MVKLPTSWSENPSAEANRVAYDDPTVAYDGSTVTYDGVVDGDMSDRDILPTEWDKTEKTPVAWTETNKLPTEWGAM